MHRGYRSSRRRSAGIARANRRRALWRQTTPKAGVTRCSHFATSQRRSPDECSSNWPHSTSKQRKRNRKLRCLLRSATRFRCAVNEIDENNRISRHENEKCSPCQSFFLVSGCSTGFRHFWLEAQRMMKNPIREWKGFWLTRARHDSRSDRGAARFRVAVGRLNSRFLAASAFYLDLSPFFPESSFSSVLWLVGLLLVPSVECSRSSRRRTERRRRRRRRRWRRWRRTR